MMSAIRGHPTGEWFLVLILLICCRAGETSSGPAADANVTGRGMDRVPRADWTAMHGTRCGG
jgi:hypothetical protein